MLQFAIKMQQPGSNSSRYDLKELNSSEILVPDYLSQYQQGIDVIWNQLVSLHSNIFVLNRLLDFRDDLFLDPHHETFFPLIKRSLLEGCLLGISKLLNDSGKGTLNLENFKNQIREWVKPVYEDSFQQSLRATKFSKTTRDSRKMVRSIRDQWIAHRLVDKNLRPVLPAGSGISFQDMEQIANDLKKLFDVLSFDTEHSVVPVEYFPGVQFPQDIDPRTDVEYFLDLVIQNSYLLNLPETEPKYWRYHLEGWDKEDIKILNHQRKRFGLSELQI